MEGRRRTLVIMRRVGLGLAESRIALRLSQAKAAERAGISQASWSRIERGATGSISLETLASCASAVGVQLAAFIEARPGADLPRDLEHLRRQSLVVRISQRGEWAAQPELAIDDDAPRSRSIDVYLARAMTAEIAVVEIVDLLADGGAAMRGLSDKVAAVRRRAPAGWRVQGILILRATARNRTTVADVRALFAARFAGSSAAWLRALTNPAAPMPGRDGLIWSNVAGTRLVAARLSGPSRAGAPGPLASQGDSAPIREGVSEQV